jgi:6-phosphofructokinase
VQRWQAGPELSLGDATEKDAMNRGNLMIVQGGGPTAVLNVSLASVIAEATGCGEFKKILGARAGAVGLAHGNFVDLTQMTSDELQTLRNSPGAALRSSRSKPDEPDLDRQVENLRRLEVQHLIVMGGNGTMRGAEVLSAACRARNLDMQVMGVPKTVDNDIAVTDRCPGYASAARYVAQSTRELGMDVRSLPQPVTILETMGRSVGWLSAVSTLARVGPDDAPHLVYVPEVAFREEAFLADLDKIVTRQGWAVVVVAEGIRSEDGGMVYELKDPAQMDPLQRPLTGGVSQYLAGVVAKNLKIRCRSERPGLLGRSSMAHVSTQDRKDAEVVGRAAVRALLQGETGKMVALLPLRGIQQGWGEPSCNLIPLSEVAGVERPLPAKWLTGGPLAVSDAFCDYARPLIGELAEYCQEFPPSASVFGAA